MRATTGNETYVNLPKNCLKKFVKSLRLDLFSAGFSFLEPLCATGRSITLTKERAEASRSHLGKAELLQLNHTQSICLTFFTDETVKIERD